MNNLYINQRNFILLALNTSYLLALFCWSFIRWNDAAVISLYKDKLALWIFLQICCFLINIKIKHVNYYDFGL